MRRVLLIVMAISLVATCFAFAGDHKEEKKVKKHKVYKQCTTDPDVCKQKIAEKMARIGMIGVDGEWDDEKGVFIIKTFFEGSNGESAGLAVGDMLVAINGVKMADEEAYKGDAENRIPGTVVPVTFLRDEAEQTIKLELIATPKSVVKKEITRHLKYHHKEWWKQHMKEKEKEKKTKEK